MNKYIKNSKLLGSLSSSLLKIMIKSMALFSHGTYF